MAAKKDSILKTYFRDEKLNDESLEKELLSFAITKPELMPSIVDEIESTDFFKEANQIIWECLKEMYFNNLSISSVLLINKLGEKNMLENCGGYLELSKFAESMPVGGLKECSQILSSIVSLSTRRKMIRQCIDLVEMAKDRERQVEDCAEIAQSRIIETVSRNCKPAFDNLQNVVSDLVEDIRKNQEKPKGQISGKSIGFHDLDVYTGGLEPTDLMIIAARPSVGKTALACNIIKNVIKLHDAKIAFFSLEMDSASLMHRLICIDAAVNGHKIKNTKADFIDLQSYYEKADYWKEKKNNLYLSSDSSILANRIRSQCRKIVSTGRLDAIVIDYLQIMGALEKTDNDYQKITRNVQALKLLSKEIGVPVIALAQIGRDFSKSQSENGSLRPGLQHLKGSGEIEQAADKVLIIHRDMVEFKKDDEGKPERVSDSVAAEIIIAKNRNGPRGMIKMMFSPDTNVFGDYITEENL